MLQQISGKIVRNGIWDRKDDTTITVIAACRGNRELFSLFRRFGIVPPRNDKSYKTKTGAASFDWSPVFSFMLTVVTIKSQAFRYLTDSPWPSALWGLGCVKFISLGCLSP
jgi:hypothetical protein